MAASSQIYTTSLEKMDTNPPQSSISIEEGSETQQCTPSEGATPFSVQQDATSGGATPLTMTNKELHEGFLKTSLTDVIDELLAQGKRVMLLVIDMNCDFYNYKPLLDFVAGLPTEFINNHKKLQTIPTEELIKRLKAVDYEKYQSQSPSRLPELNEINQFSDLFTNGGDQFSKYAVLNIALLVEKYKYHDNAFLVECILSVSDEIDRICIFIREKFPINQYYECHKADANICSEQIVIYKGNQKLPEVHFTQILNKLKIEHVVISGYHIEDCVLYSAVGYKTKKVYISLFETFNILKKYINTLYNPQKSDLIEEWILTFFYGLMSKCTILTSCYHLCGADDKITEEFHSQGKAWARNSTSVYECRFDPLKLSEKIPANLPQYENTDGYKHTIPKLIEQSSIADEQVHLLLQEASKKITQKIVDVLLNNGIDLYSDKNIPDISEEKAQEISCIVYREIKETLNSIDQILHKIETSDVPVTELLSPLTSPITTPKPQQQSNEANNDVCTESMEVNTYSPEPMEETPSVLVSTGTYTGLTPPHSKKLTVSPAEGGKPISIAKNNESSALLTTNT